MTQDDAAANGGPFPYCLRRKGHRQMYKTNSPPGQQGEGSEGAAEGGDHE